MMMAFSSRSLKNLLSSNVARRGLNYGTIANNKRGATELNAEPKLTKKEKGQKTESKKKDSDAPKRPPGAFFIFMEELRNTFKLNFPGEKSVGKAGGEKWKALSETEKTPYLEKASKRKAEYQLVLQEYKNKQIICSLTSGRRFYSRAAVSRSRGCSTPSVKQVPVTFFDLINQGSDEIKLQTLKQIYELATVNISKGKAFGSLDPKLIRVVDHMPVLPPAKDHGRKSESYLVTFSKLLTRYAFQGVPTDMILAEQQSTMLFHVRKNCKSWEDFRFIFAFPRFQSQAQASMFIPFSIMQLNHVHPRNSFPQFVNMSNRVGDFKKLTVLKGVTTDWQTSYNSMFPTVNIDFAAIIANSTEEAALQGVFDHKKRGGRKGYRSSASNELTFIYNARKHFHEHNLSTPGFYSSQQALRRDFPYAPSRLSCYITYINQNYPRIRIDTL